jgi:hypothetical protein
MGSFAWMFYKALMICFLEIAGGMFQIAFQRKSDRNSEKIQLNYKKAVGGARLASFRYEVAKF